MLVQKPRTVDQLAEIYDVSRRTIFRDLDALREGGVHVRIDPAYQTQFAETEWLSTLPCDDDLLALLCHLTASINVLPALDCDHRAVSAAAEILAELLSPQAVEKLETFRSQIVVTQDRCNSFIVALFTAAQRALDEECCLRIFLQLPDRPKAGWLLLQVLRLRYEAAYGWAIEGVLANSDQTCRIALARITDVSVENESPASSDLAPELTDWESPDLEAL